MSKYLALTIELIVFPSCGLSSPSPVFTLLVTLYDKLIKSFLRGQVSVYLCLCVCVTEREKEKTGNFKSNLPICYDNQNMVLPTTSLHDVYCSLNNWCIRCWPLNTNRLIPSKFLEVTKKLLV